MENLPLQLAGKVYSYRKGLKMGIFRKIGNGLGHVFDFRFDRWLNLKMIKDNTDFFISETKSLFSVEQQGKTEIFENAIERLELTPDFIEKQIKRYYYMACLYLIASALLFLYGVFEALQDNLMGASICFALIVYTLSCAFRYHFWCYQMKEKRLGCTVQEWFKSIQSR